jgi:hypothetical protein
MRHFEVGARAALLLLALAAGCSRDVASAARWGSASTAAVSSSSGLLLGSTASVPIDVAVLAPAPGSWLASPDVTVSGVVRRPDPAALSQVSLNGAPATLGPGGAFQARLHLGLGVASVTVLVTDTKGNETATTASYMVGPVSSLAAPVVGAVTARVDASAFGPLGGVTTATLDQLDWNAILVPLNPFLMPDVLYGAIELDIVSVDHGAWQTTVVPQQGSFAVTAAVPDVRVQVLLHDPSGSFVPIRLGGEVDATLVRGTATASLALAPGGPATVMLTPPVIDLQGTTLTLTGPVQGPVASFVLSLVQQTLVARVEAALSRFVAASLTRVLDAHLASVLMPSPVSLGGATFTFASSVTGFDVDARAAVVTAAIDVTAPVGTGMSPAPGFPAGAGPPPVLGPGSMVTLALSPELLAKGTTVAWQSGAMNQDVDASAWAQLGPSLPPLDVSGFSQLVPELATVLGPATPLVLRVRPQLPPLLAVAPGASVVTLELGELRLEVWAVIGNTLVPALAVTVHGTVPVEPSLASGSLAFATGPVRPHFSFAVVSQPLVRVDATGLETRLTIVVDALLPQLLSSIAVPLPLVQGQCLTNVQVSAAGPLGDYLSVGGDF